MKINAKIFSLVLSGVVLSSSALWAGALESYNSGLSKQNREDYYGASEDFHQALQANPSYGDAWFHLSEVTYAIG
ncbi:MAG: hypothetical protein IKN34_07455, partial [Treponema sp.]|nr:hypothetical protein [Treponema sp.]